MAGAEDLLGISTSDGFSTKLCVGSSTTDFGEAVGCWSKGDVTCGEASGVCVAAGVADGILEKVSYMAWARKGTVASASFSVF